MRHLARQRRQRRLRRGIGGPGERMHAHPGDRGDIDHRPLAAANSSSARAQASTGAKKFTWKTCPHVRRSVSSVLSRAPPSPLGEIPALLTNASSSPFSFSLDQLDRSDGLVRIGKVDLDVVFLTPRPRAARIERLARAGQHPPTTRRKALHRGMADPPACPSQNQGASAVVSPLMSGTPAVRREP